MTTQIDVVDINDNAVTEEVKEVKPRVRKTILKTKAKVQPEPVKE